MIGQVLGSYQVLAKLGEGGMGEVFRARDTTLNRDVAMKVLPAAFADDPERLARFTREAQTLASLNHPNIATIHGLEKAPDFTALVMELVEGDDLSQRIARGAIPLDEALPMAKQIAEALEAAHEQGIIHRDLKPANIKIRPDGTVKVLDFGLAKAMEPTAGSSSSQSMSPTITTPALLRHGYGGQAMTQAGMILGTPAYMSPEQARGQAVDKRADIWAFGVVLYEMLTGRRAFSGEDISETLASVLKDALPLDALPATVPPRLRRLIQRCLERDRKTRLRDIGEARIEIARIETGGADDATSAPQTASAGPPARSRLPWALVAALGIALAAGLLAWAPWRVAPSPALVRLSVDIGADASLAGGDGASAILSPDGQTLAFVATPSSGGPRRLFLRRLDQLQATPLAGTDDAAAPFFSPDGQWLGFFANGKLNKLSITGGAVVALCDTSPTARGGTWVNEDTIIFSPSNLPGTRLLRVSSTGGNPEPFATRGLDSVAQAWPQGIAGRVVLYTEGDVTDAYGAPNLVMAPLDGGAPTIVVRGGYFGRYVPTGHIIYMQRDTLVAQRFDLDRLEPLGQAVPVQQGVAANPGNAHAQVAFSSNGTLVYRPGTVASRLNPIDWMTRDGKTSVLRAATANWDNPRFSPDGRKLALEISDGKQRDIWIYDWARDTLTQLTFDASQDLGPVWTPDGRRIAFASDRAKPGTTNLYMVNADGTGEVTRLTDSPNRQGPTSWHPDGKILAFYENVDAVPDLMTLRVDGDGAQGWKIGKAEVFLRTKGVELWPEFSPDGRWIAYVTQEAQDTFQVYVRPFPGPGTQRRISTDVGSTPRWSRTSDELLFVDYRQGRIMVAPYTVAGESFQVEKPRLWSPAGPAPGSPYDLHPDGKRLALVAPRAPADVVNDKVVLLFNFFDELKRL
jgi:serine/threonine-protein kinase